MRIYVKIIHIVACIGIRSHNLTVIHYLLQPLEMKIFIARSKSGTLTFFIQSNKTTT